MENLLLTVNIVLPIFLVMMVGLFCRKIKVVDASHVSAMNKLVFKVLLPCSLAKSLMTADTSAGGFLPMMAYCFLAALATFGLAMLIVPKYVKENSRRGVMIHTIFRSNTAIFGISLAEALFPEGDGGAAAMMIAASVPLFNVLAVFTMEYFRGGKFDARKTLIGILKNPLIWACAIGLFFMLTPIKLPEFVISTVGKLGGACTPVALFALGASLNIGKIGGNLKALVAAIGVRLIVAPAILLTIAYLLGFRGHEFGAMMIAFASPSAVTSYTMSAEMDGDAELAAQIVMIGTVCCAFTIFAQVFLFKSVGLF